MSQRARIMYGDKLAGYLDKYDEGYRFTYDKGYLESTEARPVSLTLPLSEYPYTSRILVGRILKKFISATNEVFNLIDRSFLSEPYKETYKSIWLERLKRINPSGNI